MIKRSWILFVQIVSVISVVLLLFDWRYSISYLLGSIASLLVYWNTVRFVDQTLAAGIPIGAGMHSTRNFAIWSIVLIVSALLPEYLNILATALGLFSIRFAILLNEWLERRKG